MKENKGKFIVIEGIDKAGKDTQAERLVTYLEELGYQVLLTREPTNGVFGKKVRDILTGKKPPLDPMQLQKLFITDRKDHQKDILSAVKNGQIVICVRYWFSTVAYGMAEGLGMKELISLNQEFIYPDLIIFLDLLPGVAIKRMALAGDRPEYFEKKESLEKVYSAYRILFSQMENQVFLNADKSVEELSAEITCMLKNNLGI